MAEGVHSDQIWMTGNPVIDALLELEDGCSPPYDHGSDRVVLVTAHRRESLDGNLEAVAAGLADCLIEDDQLRVVWPVHPNPKLRTAVRPLVELDRAHLIEPLDYRQFVGAMKGADLIVTDSGGIQEEAPALAKPLLVIREETERPEVIETGQAILVGTSRERIRESVLGFFDGRLKLTLNASSPFGDGKAAERIRAAVITHFERRTRADSGG